MKAKNAIVVPPGGGRTYKMGGSITSIFKADCDETGRAYSVSEWWLEPHSKGPHAHTNPEDHVWYVVEGTISVLLEEEWIDAPRGSCIVIPGGMTHNFENRTAERAGILNLNIPGGFEDHAPSMAKWFEDNPSN
jgi:mannose-6-phosphate isomerase-like protein (cupin superfamily)